MNIKEFAALKAGDKVVGMLGTVGEVTTATEGGVRVAWAGSSQDFPFSVQSTAWFHWRKVEIAIE